MNIKRNAERKNTLFHSKVYDAKSDELIGFTVDVSTTGLRLLAHKCLAEGHMIELRLELPKPVMGQESINLNCEVRWCTQDINPDYRAIGLSLVSPPEDLTQILEHIQQSLCFEH